MNTVTTRDGVEVLMKPKDTEINIDEACLLIGQAWHTTIDSLLSVVILIRGYMDKKGFRTLEVELEKRGLMKRSVFSMFKTIARNELINHDVKDLLPPAYNSLYYFSKIQDPKIFMEELKKEGRDTTLESARSAWNNYKNKDKEILQKSRPASKMITLGSLKMAKSEVRKNKTEIMSLLEQLRVLGVTINLGKDFK